jgi:hypothetical protein
MRTLTRKESWTPERWCDFAQRCRRLRDRARKFACTFPDTRGVGARHLDALLKIANGLTTAMLAVEDVAYSQLGPQGGCNATRGFWCEGERATDAGSGRAGIRRPTNVLTREQWIELGRELKAIQTENAAILMEFQVARGVTQANLNRFVRVERAIFAAKCKLDTVLAQQYPTWPEFTRVFYGEACP